MIYATLDLSGMPTIFVPCHYARITTALGRLSAGVVVPAGLPARAVIRIIAILAI